MAFTVFHNPRNVALGSLTLTGVTAIVLRSRAAEIHAAADDDLHESVARYATGSTAGVIELVDPVQAAAASGAHGTLSFTLTDVKGQADREVSIAGCSLGPWRMKVRRDAASEAEIPFIAESPAVVA